MNDQDQMTLRPTSLPYELRIGVTGHRDLADPDAVAQAVSRAIDRVAGVLNRQDLAPLEWVVISPLAKGADRIVARAILDRGGSLEIVTPLPLQEYVKDFAEPEDLAEFEKLCRRGSKPIELNKDCTLPISEDERSRAYADVGRAVVDSCEILIAIWNEQPASGQGGTADIVDYALRRNRRILWIDADEPEAEPRMLVAAGRAARRTPAGTSVKFEVKAFPTTAKKLSPGYHQLCAFLRDRALPAADQHRVCAEMAAQLQEQAAASGMEPSALDPVIKHVLPRHVRADQLAVHYQKRHAVASKAVFYLSAGAVSVAVFQVLFFSEYLGLILFEVVAMLAAVLWLGVNRRQAWHEKWLHDRFLAEQLRIALFTLVMGRHSHKWPPVTPSKLPFYVGPRNWLLATVRRVVTPPQQAIAEPQTLEPVKRFIIDGWLIDQRDFHVRTAKRKNAAHHRTRWITLVLFVLTLVAALLHFVGVGHVENGLALGSPARWFTFLAIALPAWGAAVHAIGKQFEYERIAARSEEMSQVLTQKADRTERASSIEQLRDVVHDAIHVVSLENYEWWVLLSFDRPVLT